MMKSMLALLIAGMVLLGVAGAIPNAIFHWADSSHTLSVESQDVGAGYASQIFALGDGKISSGSTITSTTNVNGKPESMILNSQLTSYTNGATKFGANTAITRLSYGPDLIKGTQVRFYNSMTLPFAVNAKQMVDGQLTSAGGAGAIGNIISTKGRDYRFNAGSESVANGISSQSLGDTILPFNNGLDWSFGVGYSDFIRAADLEYVGGIDFNSEVSM